MFVGPGSWSRLPPSASVGMFSYQPDLVLAICYLQVRQAPPRPPIPPPPHSSFMNPWRAVPQRGTASPRGHPSWTASVTLSSRVSGRRHSCVLRRSVGRGQRRGKAGGGGWGGQRASVTSPPSEVGSLGAITHRSLGAPCFRD